ncbi:MAG: signal recognition particle-docking protein FtsY, partial [Bdellovibrionales bacterium]|nr:signal recognition particle-docking protein FtsY [Bdellovibrionales bacterium]
EEEALQLKLKKSRTGFFSKLKDLFKASASLDSDTVEELQSILLSSDIGVATTKSLVDRVQEQISDHSNISKDQVLAVLKSDLKQRLLDEQVEALDGSIVAPATGPAVVMVVGVNGVGKTTTIAKLAYRWKQAGKKVLLAAGDTFRAAAVEQLCHWGKELEVEVVSGSEDAKPSAIVFEALDRALEGGFDILIIDTAGRLHNKANLMQELSGVRNVLQRKIPEAPHETWLVLDGSTGQNAVQQAQEFHKSVTLTGVVITKLDGTAKGGIVAAIREELGIPVRFIGVGESRANLRVFNANDFVEALFDEEGLELTEEESAVEPRRRRRRRTA